LTNIIAVAATDENDGRYYESAYDPNATNLIGAPGARIYTTQVSGFGTGFGTSFAAPFVSGAAALIASDTKDGCDRLSASQLRTKILENASRIDGLKQYIKDGRRLDVYQALNNCSH